MNPRSSIADIAGLLGVKSLALLRAYFDESGTHGGVKTTAIAGFVGEKNAWDAVERKWVEILSNHGISVFHANHAKVQAKEFAGIERPIIDDMVRSLANALKQSSLHPVWVGVDASVWDACTTAEFRKVFPKPYDLCFADILRQLKAWQKEYRYRVRRQERIGLMFAIQDEYKRRSETVFESYRRYGGTGSIGPLAFDYAKNVPALQAADFLVNELCWSLNTRRMAESGDGIMLVSKLLATVSNGQIGTGAFITEQALRIRVSNPVWLEPFQPSLEGV